MHRAFIFPFRIIAFLGAKGLALEWILETHAHADHLTAAAHGISYLKIPVNAC